jgi:hypothetical protein
VWLCAAIDACFDGCCYCRCHSWSDESNLLLLSSSSPIRSIDWWKEKRCEIKIHHMTSIFIYWLSSWCVIAVTQQQQHHQWWTERALRYGIDVVVVDWRKFARGKEVKPVSAQHSVIIHHQMNTAKGNRESLGRVAHTKQRHQKGGIITTAAAAASRRRRCGNDVGVESFVLPPPPSSTSPSSSLL